MQPIPRGVADDDRLAVVRTREGELVALDPVTGDVRWRRGRGLEPCGLPPDAVVAVRVEGPAEPEVVVLDASDGRELWSAPLPGFAGRPPDADDTSGLSFDCTVDGEEVLLRWTVRSHYRGGAAPSERLLAEQERQTDGAAWIDLRTRSVQPVEDAGAFPPPQSRPAEISGEPVAAPDVVESGRLGALRLELATPAATGTVVLRAVDPAEDTVAWQVVLDEQAQRRPPGLRP